MATMKERELIARPAAADIAFDKQWTLGKLNSSEQAVVAGANEHAFVIEETGKAGQAITLALSGTTKVKVGAAVAPMQLLASNASGLAVPATAGQRVIGMALSVGSASGAIVTMRILTGLAPA